MAKIAVRSDMFVKRMYIAIKWRKECKGEEEEEKEKSTR